MNVSDKHGAEAFPKDQPEGALWVIGSFLNLILAACRANAPYSESGDGITWTITQKGLRGKVAASGSSADFTPLYCVNASDTAGTKIRVVSGSIGGPEATSMSLGDVPQCILSVSGSGYVYATIDIVAGVVTSWDPTSSPSIPDDDVDPATRTGTVYFKLCSFQTIDSALAIADRVTGSQAFQYCGQALFGVI